MIYAIISDIHANESALRHVLSDASAVGAESIICLGDIAGYGPMPLETLALVRKTAATVIAGNHDDAVCGRMEADGFVALASEAISRHREALSSDDLAYLRSLPYQCRFGDALAVHGDFTDPRHFNYIETEDDAYANFKAADSQLLFVGHTHVPAIFVIGQSGNVHRLDAQNFALESGKRYIVNPGSVGYPRAEGGSCFSSYVLYDSERRTVSFRRLPFSVASVMQRGNSTRRRWLWPLAVVAALGIAAGGVLAYRATQPTRVKLVRLEVPASENPALVIERRSLTLVPDMKTVRANLKLDPKFGRTMLEVEFKSADGETLGTKQIPVAKSSSKAIGIPKGAISAHFVLTKIKSGDNPRVLAFAPSASK